MKRHKELRNRRPQRVNTQQAAVSEEKLKNWFSDLENYIRTEVDDSNDLLSDRRRFFNADESGFALCPRPKKVVVDKCTKNIYEVTTTSKEQITVLISFNAAGSFVPPTILMKGSRLRNVGIQGFPQAHYGVTESGWMNSEMFCSFLSHLNDHVCAERIPKPVILFVDGHRSHISYNASTYAKAHGILLYCLLPNATHILQPADVGLFSPMKTSWSSAVKDWHVSNLGMTLSKHAFPALFKGVFEKTATEKTATNAFRKCGLFPLDFNSIDSSRLVRSLPVSEVQPEPEWIQDNASVASSDTLSAPSPELAYTAEYWLQDVIYQAHVHESSHSADIQPQQNGDMQQPSTSTAPSAWGPLPESLSDDHVDLALENPDDMTTSTPATDLIDANESDMPHESEGTISYTASRKRSNTFVPPFLKTKTVQKTLSLC